MPVPKRKRSRARRDSRHAHKAVVVKSFSTCKNCQAASLPHQACKECGHYKGVKVLTTKVERVLKRDSLNKAKATRQQSATKMASEQSE